MLSTSDLLALIFGITSIVLAVIAIIVAHKTRVLNHVVGDTEAHSLGVDVFEAERK